MKRKLIVILLILFILSIAIGTSPIVDYFYSLGAAEVSTAPVTSKAPDEISPATVWAAVALSSITVIVAFVIFLRKRKV